MVHVEKIEISEKNVFDLPNVHVLYDRCSGCQECIIRCPTQALTLDDENWIAKADNTLCVGCRQCVRTCPFSAIYVEGPLVVTPTTEPQLKIPHDLIGNSDETNPGFNDFEDMLAAAQRCISCPDPTCVRGCPAHNDIPGFIKAAQQGDLERAMDILSVNSCLPAVCSRVCDWNTQCEASCTWSLAGGSAVEIGKIERYIADHTEGVKLLSKPQNYVSSVAVVGSGPAGIGAAYELVRNGVKVTVYEHDTSPGGVMRWGIPSYVLPSSTWIKTVNALENSGVEFRYESSIDPNNIGPLYKEHDAVIFASGANQSIVPNIEGLDLLGIENAKEFLNMAKFILSVASSDPILLGTKVLVLGAGNTAMDVARSVRRLGGDAIAVDWMDERFTKARPDEIAQARDEGVEVHFLTTVSKLIPNSRGEVESALLTKTTQTGPLSIPKLNTDETELIDVDLVVTALGYRVANEWKSLSNLITLGAPTPSHIPIAREWQGTGIFAKSKGPGRLAYDREGARVDSSFPINNRTWAIGDLRVGPSTVVASMAQGMSAARGVLSSMSQNTKTATSQNNSTSQMYVGKVLIVHDGTSDNVQKCTEYMGRIFWGKGWEVAITSGEHLEPLELMTADLIIYGSQVEGLILGKVHPSRQSINHIDQLPPLFSKKVATFVVHALTPRNAGGELLEHLRNKGADILISGEILTKNLINESKTFAEDVIEEFFIFPDKSFL